MNIQSKESAQSVCAEPVKQVVVRAFGARLLGGKEAQGLAASVFWSQNQLWNKLVEIENEHRELYRAALNDSDEELAAINVQLQQEQLQLDALIDARNRVRATKRAKKTENATNYADLIKAASARMKALRVKSKDRKTTAKLAAQPLIETAEEDRRDKVKQAVAASGMWWSHHESVTEKYDIARVKAMKQGATLRFHRFEGEGSMRVRFTGEPRPMNILASGRSALLSVRDPLPEELGRMQAKKADGGMRKIIELQAGAKGDDKVVPKLRFLATMQAGMEIPEDMPLKMVTARCDMHVGKPEWKIVFMFSEMRERQDNVADLPRVAAGIDVGFRLVRDQEGNRELRVAAIATGDAVRYVTLSDKWLRRMERADSTRARLDEVSNLFWAQIKDVINDPLQRTAIDSLDERERFRVLAGKVQRAKGAYASLLVSLCDSHAKAGKPLGDAADDQMQIFRREAFVLQLQAHHTRRKAIDHRKHLFRNEAARIVAEAGLIAIEEFDLRQIALLTTEDGSENELPQAARKYRTWAAISELRLAIEQAAKREGRELVKVPADGTSQTCSTCGHVHDERIIDLNFVCGGCGKVWDRDENASINIRKLGLQEHESSDVATS